MAGRIIFEEEISELKSNGMNFIKNITIKQEDTPSYQNQDINDEISKGNSDGNSKQVKNEGSKNNIKGNFDQNEEEQYNKTVEKFNNPIIVGGNSGQDVLGTSPIDLQDKGNKAKGKKRPSELELLGVDQKVYLEDTEGKYDVYGDESQVYKKYRLRKSEQQVSYKEPGEWKPERDKSPDIKPSSLICNVCYREFDTAKALHIHVRSHGTVSEYICLLCFDKFKSNADLIAHKSFHSTESFLCKICKLAFSDHCDYLLHKLTHSTKTHFTCPECGLEYPKYSYKLHIVTHFDKKVKCPICDYVCNGEFNLQNHLNHHKYKITCVECGKVCKSKKYYDYHMSVHTGVKKYQCLYCGKGFGTHSMRQVHTRLHTGEKPYTCEICGHKTKQSVDLKRHMVTHESVKKFCCDMCSKKFFHKESLITHMRAHTRKSLYPCPECDGQFLSAGGLKCHLMFKHLSDRPVECKVCDKKFINDNQFRKHARSKYHKRNVYGFMTKKECSE